MSAQEVVLTDEAGKRIRVRKEGGGFVVALPRINGETHAYITLAHARLLYLYFREHLEGPPA